MPEIKHTFSGGKMNKDLDERIVPKDQYVDAMNIQVSTSEDSEVGTAQNILGNKELQTYEFQLPDSAITIGAVSDEKIDALYYLIWTENADYIVAYYRGNTNPIPILVDLNKDVLKFDPNMIVTGINVIDDMLFWTDNKNEPKKINIPRCRKGTNNNWNNHTQLINDSQESLGWTNKDIEEKHITVIKKAPITPLSMRLETSRNPNLTYTGVITISADDTIANSFSDTSRNDFSGLIIGDTFAIEIEQAIDYFGNITGIGNVGDSDGLTGWHDGNGTGQSAIPVGTKIVFKPFNGDNPPGIPVTDYVIKGVVEDAYPGAYDPTTNPNGNLTTYSNGVLVRITHIVGFPPTTPDEEETFQYVVDLFDETENLFEFKFPRFSYRYKYEDGEYSPFGPFTQVAFKAGAFDYHPRKGYNIGMTNNLTKVHLDGLVNEFTPKDVVSVEVLFKDEPSPNIYVVDTIRADDFPNPTTGNNMWQSLATTDLTQKKQFVIKSETINNVVPSNQLLRPWDNIPRKALAQDVTGSRIVYGNYVQNYNLKSLNNEKYVVDFSVNWDEVGFTDFDIESPTDNDVNSSYTINFTQATGAAKSIKSLREYQLGVVFTDKYGRETPVISNATGAIKLEKDRAENSNKLQVSLNNSNQPQELTHFKLFVKETAGEYYNMAMDRFYDAEDGNIWLSFPSSDRNKIDIDTFLILKKGSESDILVKEAARYKVIAIENEAPDFIKTSRMLASTVTDTTNDDVFGNSLSNAPVIGAKDFKLNYAPFFGTPGQNLYAYTEGELYIEFGKTESSEVSNRYKVASITNDWDGINTNLTGNLADAQYSIQLVEALGSDVNFITDDPTGLNSSQIPLGAKVNFYKYEVENKPQFDGRFFVKILSDDVFKRNITFSFAGGLDLRVAESRRVYLMDEDHRNRHTVDVGNFLTEGNSNNIPGDFEPYTPIGGRRDNKYGYYIVDEFTSFALYFRRYNKTKTNYDALAPSGINDALWSDSPFLTVEIGNIIPSRPVLRHLQPGANTVIGNMGNAGPDPADNLWQDPSETTYLNETWSPQTKWFEEYGAPLFRGGYTANFSSFGGAPQIRERNYSDIADEDNARDTEVWFIDAGPYSGIRTGDNYLDWGGITSDDGAGNSFSDIDQHSVTFEEGLTQGGGNWRMNLAFGGISNAEEVDGFFNIGSWNSAAGNPTNSNYLETSDVAFVNYISTGFRFKWREDPTETVYTISGTVNQKCKLRHSVNEGTLVQNTNPAPFTSMAEKVSFNFTKGWDIWDIQPSISISDWDPTQNGKINNGLEITLTTVNNDGTTGTSGDTCVSAGIDEDVIVFVSSLSGTNAGPGGVTGRIHQGMALRSYTKANNSFDTLIAHLGASAQRFLVVRYIEEILDSDGLVTHYALYLGGYSGAMTLTDHAISTDTAKKPLVNTDIEFVQVGMNGYSPNSEFNINTMASDIGAVGSVGYTLEFVEDIEPEAIMSENPAIFETEPKEIKGLDVYYEASNAIPMVINSSNIHEAFPINSWIAAGPFATDPYVVIGYSGQDLIINEEFPVLTSGDMYNIIMPDKMQMEVEILSIQNTFPGPGQSTITIDPNIYNNKINLAWHNCYSFKNGVESNRIRDNFNLPFIANGVKVSTTLEHDYEEEHRKYGLIYSGIYNSVSGVNNTNQFIAAEKITKDINPIYGSIQKLHSRDSDLVTLCEDKVLRIQANKDALFNADGNSNVTASSNVLGQTIPFSGEYGISTNPESFASESYRAYFSDKVRGTIMRLSKDGLTPISDAGMKDWFRDNLKISRNIIGSYDDRNDEYNVKVEKYYLTDLNSGNNGWINNSGSGVNIDMLDILTGGSDSSDENCNDNYTIKDYSKVLSFKEDVRGWVSFKSFVQMQFGISMGNDYYTFKAGRLYRHYDETEPRNTFYEEFTPSSVDVILNANPSFGKVFQTINYEGSQAKVDKFKEELMPHWDENYAMVSLPYSDQEYYNLSQKEGWHLESIITDKEDGYINEFLEKESKWFNYIKKEIDTCLSDADTGDFSFQGIGEVGATTSVLGEEWADDPLSSVVCDTEDVLNNNITTLEPCLPPVFGCTDNTSTGYAFGQVGANNYNPLATIDDGSCEYPDPAIGGCMDANAWNYNPDANVNTGCLYLGCTDITAINYVGLQSGVNLDEYPIGCGPGLGNSCCEYDTGPGDTDDSDDSGLRTSTTGSGY